MNDHKKCTRCQIVKPIEAFYKKRTDSAVRRPECQECSKHNNKKSYSKEYNTKQCRKWAANNRERSREIKKRHQNNSLDCRLRMALRNRLYYAVSGRLKDISAIRHLGCTVKELRLYIESQFLPGMTWDNWSQKGWHIDHIKPLSKFDLFDPEQVKLAVHYTNLKPMWAFDNQSKGNKCRT